jgi:hypothetical protein
MFVVDLLDLPPLDTQPTLWQDHVSHLVTQAPGKRLDGLLWLQSEGQVQHLSHLNQPCGKAEAIGGQPGLHGGLRHQEAQGIMSQKQPRECLPHSRLSS